jgi:hypothetical protein
MDKGKVAIIPEEADRVRHIFSRYLELGSVHALMRDLRERNIVSKQSFSKPAKSGVGFPSNGISCSTKDGESTIVIPWTKPPSKRTRSILRPTTTTKLPRAR